MFLNDSYISYQLGNNTNGIVSDIYGENFEELGTYVSSNSDGSIIAIGTPKYDRTQLTLNTGNIKVYKYKLGNK
mgnify:CR=1 FL=1